MKTGDIQLSQVDHARSLVKRYDAHIGKCRSTPLPFQFGENLFQEGVEADVGDSFPFREILGGMM